MTKTSWIPEISDEKLKKLARKIKPIVRDEKNVLRYIKSVDLRNIAYTWSPVFTKKAPEFSVITDTTTYHTWGYYGFFKPSIAEVIAQIPPRYLDRVCAFEIIKSPENISEVFGEQEALNAGYHVAITRLYEKSGK